MTTRAGRAFKTLNDRIRLLEGINTELLQACKTVHYLLSYPSMPQAVFDKIRKTLKQAIAKAEGM